MFVKKISKTGYTLVIGVINLPQERVVGRDVEYKYKVVTPAGDYWETLTIPQEYSYSRPVINRVLQIPKDYSHSLYEKYDDVIMKDNDRDRSNARKMSTKFLLPGLVGNIKKISAEKKQQNINLI